MTPRHSECRAENTVTNTIKRSEANTKPARSSTSVQRRAEGRVLATRAAVARVRVGRGVGGGGGARVGRGRSLSDTGTTCFRFEDD